MQFQEQVKERKREGRKGVRDVDKDLLGSDSGKKERKGREEENIL